MNGMEMDLELDARLMLHAAAGDDASLETLLARHRSHVIHYLYRMVQNQAAAEDLAQEVFLRVYRARHRYRPTAKFTTWLYQIATNLALNWVRDHRWDAASISLDDTWRLADSRPSADSDLVRRDRLHAIRAAVAELPERQRAVVILHKYHEMDYSAIAASLNCSVSAVKSLMFRAYETLRARLAAVAGDV